MGLCNVGYEKACDTCGSKIFGAVHNQCGNIVCGCEPCPICFDVDEGERARKRSMRDKANADGERLSEEEQW